MEGTHHDGGHHDDMAVAMQPPMQGQPGPDMMGGQGGGGGGGGPPQGYPPMGHPAGYPPPPQYNYGAPPPPGQQPPPPQQPPGGWQGSGGGGGWSQPPMNNPGIPGVECRDADIVISTGLEHSRTREANLEYQRLLLANCALFGSLPTHYQSVHAQHIYHFLTHVRGRRFLQCIAPNVYIPFGNGPLQIAQEITGDPCKMAFASRNPQWLLDGLRVFTTSADPPAEQSWVHRSNPRGNEWDVVTLEQVKTILKEEGPVHLLILPPGIEPKLSASAQKDERLHKDDGGGSETNKPVEDEGNPSSAAADGNQGSADAGTADLPPPPPDDDNVIHHGAVHSEHHHHHEPASYDAEGGAAALKDDEDGNFRSDDPHGEHGVDVVDEEEAARRNLKRARSD